MNLSMPSIKNLSIMDKPKNSTTALARVFRIRSDLYIINLYTEIGSLWVSPDKMPAKCMGTCFVCCVWIQLVNFTGEKWIEAKPRGGSLAIRIKNYGVL